MQVTAENLSTILSGLDDVHSERRRQARLLAEGLVLSLRIQPEGRGLVAWLSDPNDHAVTDNNLDAITRWVLKQLDLAGADQEPRIATLMASLRDTFDELMDCE